MDVAVHARVTASEVSNVRGPLTFWVPQSKMIKTQIKQNQLDVHAKINRCKRICRKGGAAVISSYGRIVMRRQELYFYCR